MRVYYNWQWRLPSAIRPDGLDRRGNRGHRRPRSVITKTDESKRTTMDVGRAGVGGVGPFLVAKSVEGVDSPATNVVERELPSHLDRVSTK